MIPEQIQAKSSEKVRQVLSFMEALNITVEARERVNAQGFIEKLVFWIDNEKYVPTPIEGDPVGGSKGIPSFMPPAPTGEAGAQ